MRIVILPSLIQNNIRRFWQVVPAATTWVGVESIQSGGHDVYYN
jgi:hypothetical protein